MDQPQPWPARLRASLNERLVDVPDYVPYEPGPGRLPVAPPGSTATKRPSVWLSHGALLPRRHHRHLLRANPLPHSPLLPTLSFTLSSTLSSTRTAAALTAAALTAAALAAAALAALAAAFTALAALAAAFTAVFGRTVEEQPAEVCGGRCGLQRPPQLGLVGGCAEGGT